MSTNQTSNYQLHLWEPGDDFLREEFNENSEKIDAALAIHDGAVAAAAVRVKLMEVTTAQNCQQVTLDVSVIDWTAWAYIELHSCMLGHVQNNSMVSYLRVNGSASNLIGMQNVLNQPEPDRGLFCRAWLKWSGSFFFADFRCLKAHQNNLNETEFHNGEGSGAVLLKTAPLTLNMVLNTSGMTPSDNYYLPGSRLTLWGVR